MSWPLRQALAEACRQASAAGLMPGHSGNASVRTSSGFLVTPTGAALRELAPGDLVELDDEGRGHRARQGTRTSEWRLHRDLLRARPEINAVMHTHSRFATVFSCLRKDVSAVHYMIAVSGADVVRCAEYATYGTEALSQNALLAMGSSKACLLANHGLVALGETLDDAVRVAVEIENVAALEWHARSLGAPVVLDRSEMTRVIEKFKGYGKVSE